MGIRGAHELNEEARLIYEARSRDLLNGIVQSTTDEADSLLARLTGNSVTLSDRSKLAAAREREIANVRIADINR
jgi:hypothetical protein